ncbi:MAG TPA: glycine cleavage system aminomethyltransferase GcvT [Oscillospiraceae bacterium]|nr:glycine cleavage system aminomethyltransferase GcvT [Oscillospiraceae bacterium]
MDRKTPLYDIHLKYGGKIVSFGGYLLPVQYGSGVIAEHMAVRTKCGLFDVSHMGEILCEGPEALTEVNRLLTNDFTDLTIGAARYSPMCNERGGTVDDLLVYRTGETRYLLVVNASNREKDFAWMQAHREKADFTDISDTVAQLALQGPLAEKILLRLADQNDIPEKYYTFKAGRNVGGVKCLVSRTGYTGEDGFELYCAAGEAARLWELLLDAGRGDGLIPCGLGARDTLRLEAAMPLYGHELSEEISPREAGLGIFVKMKKPSDFIGKAALEIAGAPARRRAGLKVTGRGIVREHMPVFAGEAQVGVTTSGTHCPYLGYPAAMAILNKDAYAVGKTVEVEVRGRRVEAEIVPLPFYKRA